MMSLIMSLPITFIFLLVGFIMWKGNIDKNYAVGYRTRRSMQSEEAFKYANKKSGKYFVLIAILNVILLLISLKFFKNNSLVGFILVVLPIVLIFLSMILIERDLKKKFGDEQLKKSSKKTVVGISIAVIALIVALVVGASTYENTGRPFSIGVSGENISIHGWGNAEIQIGSIKEIKFLKNTPNVMWNDGGGSIHGKIYGDEHLNIYGETKCFVENAEKPSLYIKTNSTNYLIGLNKESETEKIYKEIEQAIQRE